MRDTTRLTRRRWLAGCGAGLALSTAGCLGGDGSSQSDGSGGDGSGDSGDGSAATGGESGSGGASGGSGESEDVQPQGELVLTEEVTDTTNDYKFDLEEGDTITVVMEGETDLTYLTGDLKREPQENARLIGINTGGHVTRQYTAEWTSTYSLRAGTNGEMTVEVYVDRS